MPVYLDHNATTPLDQRVLDAMLPYLTGPFGNPSSVHRYGRAARAAIDRAREQIAAFVGAQAAEIIFTGGGTEANNLAIKGIAATHTPGRVLVGATEHPAVLEPAQALTQNGWQCEHIAVNANAVVTPTVLAEHLRDDVRLVSVMTVNNETGSIQPVAALAEIVHQHGAIFHTDAVQAVGKLPLDFAASGVDLLTLTAHKFYGPKGVGALVVNKRIDIQPLLHGGGQEQGLRGGTENLAATVGFGAAAVLAQQERDARMAQVQTLRDAFERELAQQPNITIFAQAAERLPNTCQFSLAGIEGETLLMALDKRGIAVSSGSACASDKTEPSHVLTAMGVPHDVAIGAIRVSFGQDNTHDDVRALLGALAEIRAELRI